MTFASMYQLQVYLLWVNTCLAKCLNSVFNVKVLVRTFNLDKALGPSKEWRWRCVTTVLFPTFVWCNLCTDPRTLHLTAACTGSPRAGWRPNPWKVNKHILHFLCKVNSFFQIGLLPMLLCPNACLLLTTICFCLLLSATTTCY